MKTMKKIVISGLLVVAVLFSGLGLQAQDKAKKSPDERAGKMTAWMAEKLDLTAEQTEAVREVNTNKAIEMQSIKEEHKGDKDAMRSEFQRIGKEHSAAMKSILDDQQFAKYEKMKKEKRGWKGKKGHEKGHGHKNDRSDKFQKDRR